MDDHEEDEDEGQTLYDVLLCAPSATDAELRQAYKQQAMHWHPDKNDDAEAEERFKLINTAWSVLSDETKRKAYDQSLVAGGRQGQDGFFHDGGFRAQQHADHDAAAAAAAARECWQAFMEAEANERRRERRRERSFLVGTLAFACWLVALLLGTWCSFGHSALFFPRALELSNSAVAKLPLDLDLAEFQRRVEAQQLAPRGGRGWLDQLSGAVPLMSWYTPYLRISLNASTDTRRAPDVGRPKGRGWLLLSSNTGEDIYGRPLNLVSRTFLFFPASTPQPWPPPGAICTRLLKSGAIKQKEWFYDLQRAVGGRLRPFALAVVALGECEPDFGGAAILLSTLGALLASQLTVRVVLDGGG